MEYSIPVVALGLITALCGYPASAQNATPSPVTGNVAAVSDYTFRGLTQTWGHPALQGGADYTNPNGFAAGTWASSISERSYPGGAMELDLYANYGRAIDRDWCWRAGLYSYVYPGGNLDRAHSYAARSFNTTEANLSLTWKTLSLKYSRSLTDYFGADIEQGYRGDSRGTGYLQLDAVIPLNQAWSVSLHAAHTDYATSLVVPTVGGTRNPDYSDYGASVKYQYRKYWSINLGITRASNAAFYRHTASFLDAADTRNVGGTRGFVMLQSTF